MCANMTLSETMWVNLHETQAACVIWRWETVSVIVTYSRRRTNGRCSCCASARLQHTPQHYSMCVTRGFQADSHSPFNFKALFTWQEFFSGHKIQHISNKYIILPTGSVLFIQHWDTCYECELHGYTTSGTEWSRTLGRKWTRENVVMLVWEYLEYLLEMSIPVLVNYAVNQVWIHWSCRPFTYNHVWKKSWRQSKY